MALGPFDALVLSAINSVGLPSGFLHGDFFSLINAVMKKESTFNPSAVSPTGEGIGLMQVNPTYWLSVFNVTREQLFDPVTNIRIGATILKDYINSYGVHGGIGTYFAGAAARFSSAAINYTNTVISFWNSFKQSLRNIPLPAMPRLPTLPGSFYFTDPSQSGSIPGFDSNQQQVSDDESYYSSTESSVLDNQQFDWTVYLMVAGAAILFLWMVDS
jgi:hypothetical protein